MDTKLADEPFWEKYQRLRLVAFSCHEAALKVLEAWASRTIPGLGFHLYEFFLEEPSRRDAPDLDPYNFVPFVDREVTSRGHCLGIPQDQKDDDNFLSEIRGIIRTANEGNGPLVLPLGFAGHLSPPTLVRRLCRTGTLKLGKVSPLIYERWNDGKLPAEGDNAPWHLFTNRRDCLQEMEDKLNNEALESRVRLGWANLFSILYTPLLSRPNTTDQLFNALAPIASPLAFYGVVSVIAEIPGTKPEEYKKTLEGQAQAVIHELVALAQQIYLPTLILMQHGWEEHKLHRFLKNDRGNWRDKLDRFFATEATVMAGDGRIPRSLKRVYSHVKLIEYENTLEQEGFDPNESYRQYPKDVNDAVRANWELERALLALWKRRFNVPAAEAVNSFIFPKMMIASPGMLNTVREVLKAASAVTPRKEKDDPFPCALVVGSPGAGKEKVSKLIPLFTEQYWNTDEIPINMAGIRDIDRLEDRLKEYYSKRVTVRLDELNSADVATQGGMLRILETGEFSKEAPTVVVDWLVLGLINEDPSQLTLGEIRERTRDTFIFGQLFGAFLYEHFKTKSRMRDDLYYRIRRCGEIRVTDLDQRREDIPIIFYFLLTTRTKLTRGIFLTYGALRQLVSSRIKWKGNVRQLELAARELVNILCDRKETSEVYTVSAGDICLALVNAKVPGASDSEWGDPNA